MDKKQIEELAKAAAHSAVTARYSQMPADTTQAVDTFLEAYEYAFKKIVEKQHQSQSEVNMEFGSNEARFR